MSCVTLEHAEQTGAVARIAGLYGTRDHFRVLTLTNSTALFVITSSQRTGLLDFLDYCTLE